MDSEFGRRGLVGALMILAVTLVIWAGVHNGRDRRLAMQQQVSPPRATYPPNLEHDQDDEVTTPKMQGKVAPGFSLVDLQGKKVSLADFKGKPVVVNFWATWCGPCKIEMPWFEEFSKKYEGQGLVVLGVVAADEAPKAVVAATAKKLGVTYPVLLKDDKVEEAYGGIDGLPQSFYVDRAGNVMLVTAGISDGQGGKDEVEANIKRLIAAGGE